MVIINELNEIEQVVQPDPLLGLRNRIQMIKAGEIVTMVWAKDAAAGTLAEVSLIEPRSEMHSDVVIGGQWYMYKGTIIKEPRTLDDITKDLDYRILEKVKKELKIMCSFYEKGVATVVPFVVWDKDPRWCPEQLAFHLKKNLLAKLEQFCQELLPVVTRGESFEEVESEKEVEVEGEIENPTEGVIMLPEQTSVWTAGIVHRHETLERFRRWMSAWNVRSLCAEITQPKLHSFAAVLKPCEEEVVMNEEKLGLQLLVKNEKMCGLQLLLRKSPPPWEDDINQLSELFGGEAVAPCLVCDRAFKSFHQLNRHYDDEHFDYRFVCTTCYNRSKTQVASYFHVLGHL